jgi:hypothetical protein
MSPPVFSIIIPTLNSRDTLLRCLEAVFSSQIECQVFVIDNGCRDGTSDAVRDRFPRVSLIRNETNQGFARAVNQGLQKSQGRYLCILNDDAVLEPDTLSRLGRFLEERADAGIVGPQLVHADGSLQNSIDNIPGLADQFLNKSLLRALAPGRYPSKRQVYEQPVAVESIIGACMVLKRDVLQKLGGLDERYFVFLEETDFCLRARQAGFTTYFYPAARVRHDQGMTGTKRAPHRTKVEYLQSMKTFLRLHRGGLVAGLYVFGLALKTLVQLIAALIGGVLTLMLARSVRRRLQTQAWIFCWLLLCCPEKMGLRHARL